MTQPLTDDQLAAIRQRAEAPDLTDGPWKVTDLRNTPDGGRDCIWVDVDNGHEYKTVAEMTEDSGLQIIWRMADAEFVAHARADVPALLAEIDRLRAAYDDVVEQFTDQYKAHQKTRLERLDIERENKRLRAVADQYEATVDRVNEACDAIEDHWRGDYDDDAEGAREAVARIRAAADDPQP